MPHFTRLYYISCTLLIIRDGGERAASLKYAPVSTRDDGRASFVRPKDDDYPPRGGIGVVEKEPGGGAEVISSRLFVCDFVGCVV